MEEELLQPLRDARMYLRWIEQLGFEVPCEALAKALGAQRAAEEAGALSTTMEEKSMPSMSKAERLESLAKEILACTRCRLHQTRTQSVPGVGNPDADLMFVGEAPGATEDKMGMPFVGQAGNVLTQELEKNGISREEVYITNVVKSRPPENRDPLPDEIEACEPWLHKQIEIIQPKLICGLGRFAVATLLKHPIGIMKLRGTWDKYQNIPLFICIHPSATLHQRQNRPLFDADIVTLAKAYHELRAS